MTAARGLKALALWPVVALSMLAQNSTAQSATSLEPLYGSPDVIGGVATAADGTLYVVFPRMDGGVGIRLGRIPRGRLVEPYPNPEWNSLGGGQDPARTFVRLSAVRFGPDGKLWVLDTGSPTFASPITRGGDKLVVIDTKSSRVARVFHLDAAVEDASDLDELRLHGDHAYITDAGASAIIVMSTSTGYAYRTLVGDPSITGPRPLGLRVHGLHLEVSPNGQYVYVQRSAGPLYRIETRYIDDAALSDAERSQHLTLIARTPTVGATAIDADGDIYLSDLDQPRILEVTPARVVTTILEDPRLVWVEALSIDRKGTLVFPAARPDEIVRPREAAYLSEPPFIVYGANVGREPVR